MSAVTVLVVDDDRDSRSLLELALTLEGYGVQSAPNGAAALERARTLHPQVILLDLAMPIMDGFTFRAEQLRDPDIAAIPVICVSGRNDADQAARDMNMAGCVRKPFLLDEIVDRIKGITDIAGAEPQ